MASSGAGSGLGGWFSICHSAFLFILSWLANVCTPLPFHSATDEVVAQTFYFNCILARKYDYHCSDSNQHIAGVEGCQLQHMKKQGHSTIAKGCRQRDMKDKILQALFEDRTIEMCAYSNDDQVLKDPFRIDSLSLWSRVVVRLQTWLWIWNKSQSHFLRPIPSSSFSKGSIRRSTTSCSAASASAAFIYGSTWSPQLGCPREVERW